MITIDLDTGDVKRNTEVKGEIARMHPYGEWNQKNRITLKPGLLLPKAELDSCRRFSSVYTIFRIFINFIQ